MQAWRKSSQIFYVVICQPDASAMHFMEMDASTYKT